MATATWTRVALLPDVPYVKYCEASAWQLRQVTQAMFLKRR